MCLPLSDFLFVALTCFRSSKKMILDKDVQFFYSAVGKSNCPWLFNHELTVMRHMF